MFYPIYCRILRSPKLFFWALPSLLVIACGPGKEEIAQETIQQRVQHFRDKKNAECMASLLATAEQITDSLLLLEAQLQLRDSLFRSRPAAPIQPGDVPPIDSLDVKPLFKKKD
jgi:hypothetical protein